MFESAQSNIEISHYLNLIISDVDRAEKLEPIVLKSSR